MFLVKSKLSENFTKSSSSALFLASSSFPPPSDSFRTPFTGVVGLVPLVAALPFFDEALSEASLAVDGGVGVVDFAAVSELEGVDFEEVFSVGSASFEATFFCSTVF